MSGPHPVVVLRWLRAGVLGVVAVTAVLYLVVANRVGHQEAAVERAEKVIGEIKSAGRDAEKADAALKKIADTDATDLTGTGAAFASATESMNSHLTSARKGNAAGKQGLQHIQFVQGQLAACVQMADTAVFDGSPAVARARDAIIGDPIRDGPAPVAFTGGLKWLFPDLAEVETKALERQKDSGWLDHDLRWALFSGPLAAMLLLVCATGWIVVTHFRRHPGPELAGALLGAVAIGVTTCTAGPPAPGIALPVLVAAGVLAHLAYRPRLAEYRFPRS